MGDVIDYEALRRARATAAATEEREERLFAFAAVRVGLEREGNLSTEAEVALRRCLVEAGLTEADLAEYLGSHRDEVVAFLSDTGL